MNRQGFSAVTRQDGLTLLEVLIAVVILSIGVLGLAGLQFAGLRNGQQSYQRSQAVLLAGQIADYMRASRDQAQSGAFRVAGATPAAPATDCAALGCTPAELAAYDLNQWYTSVTSTLPLGAATITCATTCASGDVQTVVISWDETRTGTASVNYRVQLVP